MHKAAIWGVAALVIGVINVQIFRKEQVLHNGKTILLDLAPRDPRSLMQGDYMVLRYRLARDMTQLDNRREIARDGLIVMAINRDETNPAAYLLSDDDEWLPLQFKCFYDGSELAEGEHLLRYRKRKGEIQISTDSFFFQEGHAKYYEEDARYGEIKVAESGDAVLVGLRNRQRRVIEPGEEE